MAKNLRSKLPSSDKLFIYDTNVDATSRFVKENEGAEVAENVRDVAEKSVCLSPSSFTLLHSHPLSPNLNDEF